MITVPGRILSRPEVAYKLNGKIVNTYMYPAPPVGTKATEERIINSTREKPYLVGLLS